MPIEIRELHITTTISPEAERAAADLGDALLLFGAAALGAAEDADHRHTVAFDDLAAPVLHGETSDAALTPTHDSAGVNLMLVDGSVRFVTTGLDLFG